MSFKEEFIESMKSPMQLFCFVGLTALIMVGNSYFFVHSEWLRTLFAFISAISLISLQEPGWRSGWRETTFALNTDESIWLASRRKKVLYSSMLLTCLISAGEVTRWMMVENFAFSLPTLSAVPFHTLLYWTFIRFEERFGKMKANYLLIIAVYAFCLFSFFFPELPQFSWSVILISTAVSFSLGFLAVFDCWYLTRRVKS